MPRVIPDLKEPLAGLLNIDTDRIEEHPVDRNDREKFLAYKDYGFAAQYISHPYSTYLEEAVQRYQERAQRSPAVQLLAVPHVTRNILSLAEAQQVNVIDLDGNGVIECDAPLIRIKVLKKPRRKSGRPRKCDSGVAANIVSFISNTQRPNQSDIVAALEVDQGMVSRHLAWLRLEGVIEVERIGRHKIYTLVET